MKRISLKPKAFSLVEILVTLAVIGALGVFSTTTIPGQLQKARDSVRKGNIDRVKKAIEEYYSDANCYPIALSVCGNSISLGDLQILDKIPCDPETKLSYVYVSETANCPKWFQLYGNLEYTSDKIIDKVGCRGGCGPDCQFNYGVASTNQKLNPYCSLTTPSPSGETSPIPTSTSAPGPGPQQYVCAPGGACEIYANPEISGCPDIYPNDPTCQNQCSQKEKRCHDSRGKQS